MLADFAMSPFLELLPQRCPDSEQLYEGYVARIKNTFIELGPKNARSKRSVSCTPTFEFSKLDPALAAPIDEINFEI